MWVVFAREREPKLYNRMDNRVVFNEESVPVPKLRPRGAEHMLAKLGIGTNSRDARIVLGFIAFLAVVSTFYFLASSVPPAPKLGPDIPQKGEVIPSNRTL